MRSVTDSGKNKNGELLSFNPSDTYWLARARRATGPGRLEDRALFYRKALEILPSAGTRLELAETYYRMQCFDAADALILQTLTEDGENGQAWYLLGLTSLARGDEITSQNAFDRCMRASPMSPAALKAQNMLSGYAWKRESRIPLFGFRAECLTRLALRRKPGPERTGLCALACLRRPYPRAVLALASEIAPARPRFCLFLLRYVLRDPSLRFRAYLLGAECLHRVGRDPLPCLYVASSLARNATETESLVRAALACSQASFMRARLDILLRDSPCSSALIRLKADCMDAEGRRGEAARLREKAAFLAPEEISRPESAKALRSLAVYHNRLRCGQLNRLLHRLVISLPDASPATIYRVVVPMYRGMNRDARRNMERSDFRPWDAAFTVLYALRTGRVALSRKVLDRRGTRPFILRQIRRVDKKLCSAAGSVISPVRAASPKKRGTKK